MNNAKKAFELYKEEIMCNINNYCSDAYPYSYNTNKNIEDISEINLINEYNKSINK